MMFTILITEDDESLLGYLKDFLLEQGYSVLVAQDGTSALKQTQRSKPDLLLLDLKLPDITGETVCVEVKKMYPDLPVIILTAKDTTQDLVQSLHIGADDYIAKPFEVDELLARIKARLRESDHQTSVLQVEDLTLDMQTLEVRRRGKRIDLTPQELKLLEYLMRNKGKVLTREMILNRLWASTPDIETRVVDVYIGYLRKKVDRSSQKLIRSKRGFGYYIHKPEQSD